MTAGAAPAQQPLELSLVSEVVLEHYCLLFGLLELLNDDINGIAKEARRRQRSIQQKQFKLFFQVEQIQKERCLCIATRAAIKDQWL